jgi:hypothetical protein
MTATTATISNIIRSNFGDKSFLRFDIALNTYTTGGIALAASDFGLSSIDILLASRSAGILYEYDHSNGLMLAYRQSVTIAGTVGLMSGITTTTGSITVKGGQATGTDIYLTNDTATGQLAWTGAVGFAIPRATMGLGKASMVLATTPTFAGTPISSLTYLTEVANTTNLSTAVRCIVIGV